MVKSWSPTTEMPEKPLPTVRPDVTPEAGTVVTSVPDTFWVPAGFEVATAEEAI